MSENRIPRRAIRRLSAWYQSHRRDLPWRRSRDPYRIWLSEVMLQQTQVKTVLPHYLRFLKRFPTLGSLAQAPLENVLAAWAGLGYYSRAKNLHRTARLVRERYGGDFPQEEAALRDLPGIGPYTAGAILSIAFRRPYPVLDGNVTRVLCRLLGIREDPRKTPVQKLLWRTAASCLVGIKNPGLLNQAWMELGAPQNLLPGLSTGPAGADSLPQPSAPNHPAQLELFSRVEKRQDPSRLQEFSREVIERELGVAHLDLPAAPQSMEEIFPGLSGSGPAQHHLPQNQDGNLRSRPGDSGASGSAEFEAALDRSQGSRGKNRRFPLEQSPINGWRGLGAYLTPGTWGGPAGPRYGVPRCLLRDGLGIVAGPGLDRRQSRTPHQLDPYLAADVFRGGNERSKSQVVLGAHFLGDP